MLAYIYLHTHTRSYRRESDDDRHTHTHLCLPLILRAHFFYSTPRSASWHTHTHTHTQSSCVLEILMMTHAYTHTHPCQRLIALHNTYFYFTFPGAFLLHACGVIRNAHLFHQCVTSLLSRDSRIADCTVRHPGVERPFSSVNKYVYAFIVNSIILIHTLVLKTVE